MAAFKRDSVWSRSSKRRRAVIVAIAVVGPALAIILLVTGAGNLGAMSLGVTSLVLAGFALSMPEK